MEYSIEPNAAVPFEVRFANSDLLVVEKPAGVVTQPGKKHLRDSLLNGLFCKYGRLLQNVGLARDWGLLHRLDKDTSGLVIVALRPRAYDHLLEQFKNRHVKKKYWAIVAGRPRKAQAVIQQPIAEVIVGRKKALLRRDGKKAITSYRVLQHGDDVTLIEASPKTGRLHQIRVHMAFLGNPVLGDDTYCGKTKMPTVKRLCLHAAELSFVLPTEEKRTTVHSPWPSDLDKTLKRFGFSPPDAKKAASP